MNTVVCLHMKLCNLVLAGEKNGAKQKSKPAGPVFLSHSTLWSTQHYKLLTSSLSTLKTVVDAF